MDRNIIARDLSTQDSFKNVSHTNQQWFQYYNKWKFAEKITCLSDGSFRMKDCFTETSLMLLRAGCAYSVTKNIAISGGPAITLSYFNNQLSRMEIRGWQEFNFSPEYNSVTLGNRFRLEERYFKKIRSNEIQPNYNFNYRLRYRFLLSLPLDRDKFGEKRFSLNVGDEIFINFGREIIYNTFDSNRIIAGLNYQLNKSCSIALTYVNQFSQSKARNNFEESNILWFSFTRNIERDKEK